MSSLQKRMHGPVQDFVGRYDGALAGPVRPARLVEIENSTTGALGSPRARSELQEKIEVISCSTAVKVSGAWPCCHVGSRHLWSD